MMKKLLLLHVEPLIVALRKILAEYRRFVASSPSRPSNKKVAILAARPAMHTGCSCKIKVANLPPHLLAGFGSLAHQICSDNRQQGDLSTDQTPCNKMQNSRRRCGRKSADRTLTFFVSMETAFFNVLYTYLLRSFLKWTAHRAHPQMAVRTVRSSITFTYTSNRPKTSFTSSRSDQHSPRTAP